MSYSSVAAIGIVGSVFITLTPSAATAESTQDMLGCWKKLSIYKEAPSKKPIINPIGILCILKKGTFYAFFMGSSGLGNSIEEAWKPRKDGGIEFGGEQCEVQSSSIQLEIKECSLRGTWIKQCVETNKYGTDCKEGIK